MNSDMKIHEINAKMEALKSAFDQYREIPLSQRTRFMHDTGERLLKNKDRLIQIAMKETHLPAERLLGELKRTAFQLTSYADACKNGYWMDIRIQKPAEENKPVIKKMNVPLGPVLIFGAGNFPFAYSTAGGDTACALAAGCSVMVKAHPQHAATSDAVAGIIEEAVKENNMPSHLFMHVHANDLSLVEKLVKHPVIKAVGFTGSYKAGKQIFDWGNTREQPIPVFAEMGSTNPVFILPGKMKESAESYAQTVSDSILTDAGQFCTKPGILVIQKNTDANIFLKTLQDKMSQATPVAMLNVGIYENYEYKKGLSTEQENVKTISTNKHNRQPLMGTPQLTLIDAKDFIANNVLKQEVFGPYCIIVCCRDINEMKQVASSLEGQLTCTLAATVQEAGQQKELIKILQSICGRFIFNGVPTGVQVCPAMQHGGPFPATTSGLFTSVGPDGIKRFTRPLAFQNVAEELLPDALKETNPLQLWRYTDDRFTR